MYDKVTPSPIFEKKNVNKFSKTSHMIVINLQTANYKMCFFFPSLIFNFCLIFKLNIYINKSISNIHYKTQL